eukprot:7238483-Pyramimonas_sp.AAC.1
MGSICFTCAGGVDSRLGGADSRLGGVDSRLEAASSPLRRRCQLARRCRPPTAPAAPSARGAPVQGDHSSTVQGSSKVNSGLESCLKAGVVVASLVLLLLPFASSYVARRIFEGVLSVKKRKEKGTNQVGVWSTGQQVNRSTRGPERGGWGDRLPAAYGAG